MELAVQKREVLGKKVKALREQGFIPAELYGRGVTNLHLSVSAKDFKKVFKEAGENTVVNLVVTEIATPRHGGAPAVTKVLAGKRNDKVSVLISDVSYDPVSDAFNSVDFYQVRLDEKLRTKVPVEFLGESPAVKNKEGVLVKAMQEIEVEALPNDIPHSLVADLSKLIDINQSFYVKDLSVSAKVKILVDLQSVIATIKAKLTEEQAKALEEKAVPSIETIKIETEEKKAAREVEKGAEGKTAESTGKEATPKK